MWYYQEVEDAEGPSILSPFIIDDTGAGDYTWAQAAAEDWCYGSGTWSNPYIIENVIIDAGSSGNCLEIRNSNVFFKINQNYPLYQNPPPYPFHNYIPGMRACKREG